MKKPTIEDKYDPEDIQYYPNWTPHYARSYQYRCFKCEKRGSVFDMYYHMWFHVDMCGECAFKTEASCASWDCE